MAGVYRRGQVWWGRVRFNGQHIRRSAKTTKKAEAQAYLHRLLEEYALEKFVTGFVTTHSQRPAIGSYELRQNSSVNLIQVEITQEPDTHPSVELVRLQRARLQARFFKEAIHRLGQEMARPSFTPSLLGILLKQMVQVRLGLSLLRGLRR